MIATVTVKDAGGNVVTETQITLPNGGSLFLQSDVEINGINTSGKIDARPDGFVRASIERTGEVMEQIEKSPVPVA